MEIGENERASENFFPHGGLYGGLLETANMPLLMPSVKILAMTYLLS